MYLLAHYSASSLKMYELVSNIVYINAQILVTNEQHQNKATYNNI